ncbi:MAG: Abi family protein [Actinobacteria bacterium]|nr:Abi family protein [Actinomycetota bacterium]
MLKLPKTIEEQISLLRSRNIIIKDTDEVKFFLENNNYYRLMGYAFQFKSNKEVYRPGTNINAIIGIYNFDKFLRHIIIQQLEDFEISFRTKLAYYLSHQYGSECYLKKDIFLDQRLYFDFINTIEKNIKQSVNEQFVKHHFSKYDGRFPFWVLIEILSFSVVSKLFKNLNNSDRNYFSKHYYNYDAEFVENWIHHFSVLRNTCAHYGRIYNKNLLPILKFLKEDKNKFNKTFKIFDSLFILKKVCFNNTMWIDFLKKLENLLSEYGSCINLELIGFPDKYLSILKK